LCPFPGGWDPSNTMCNVHAWAEFYTYVLSGILIHPAVWPQYTRAEKWGRCAHFRGSWIPSNTMSPRPRSTSLPSAWHLDLSSRLATTYMGRKLGDAVLLFAGGGRAGSPCNTMWPGPRPIPRTKWHLDPCSRLAAIHGPKLGGAVPSPLFGWGRIPIFNNVTWVKFYLPTKWHLDPSSRLSTTDMGRKLGWLCPLGDGWVPI